MSDPGFCLAAWSDRFSCWVSIAVERDRNRLEYLAGRLVLAGLAVGVFAVTSVDDEDVEEAALARARPPRGAFVAHDVDDVNA